MRCGGDCCHLTGQVQFKHHCIGQFLGPTLRRFGDVKAEVFKTLDQAAQSVLLEVGSMTTDAGQACLSLSIGNGRDYRPATHYRQHEHQILFQSRPWDCPTATFPAQSCLGHGTINDSQGLDILREARGDAVKVIDGTRCHLLRRHLRHAIEALIELGMADETVQALVAQRNAWPSAEVLYRMPLVELRRHVEEAESLCREA